MPSDGTTTRNSVIQKVQNRNNMAEMYLSRQMDDFKKYLTQKVLTIEMERLEWHTFLKDLRKCDSDDLQEFVPLLIDEFGEGEYTSRCRKLKTRFRDLFTAVELGLKDEKLSMDYVKIKEDGETAQKDYRMLRTELRNRPKPPPIVEPDARNPSPVKAVSRNEATKSRTTGFITSMVTPGIDQVAQANRPQALGVNKARDSQDQGQSLAVPRFGATKPFFPSIPTPKPSAQEPIVRKEKDDDLESELDLGPDSEDEEEERKRKEKKKKEKDMMRNMLDNNAKKLRKRRRMRKPKKPLENRIEEFFVKIDNLRCEPCNESSTKGYLPPIGISAY